MAKAKPQLTLTEQEIAIIVDAVTLLLTTRLKDKLSERSRNFILASLNLLLNMLVKKS